MLSKTGEIQLNKNEERRVRSGHLWIFSNEINTKKTPIKEFSPGAIVEVLDTRRNFLGTGYINPSSLIAVRLLTRDRITSMAGYIKKKIAEALVMREQLLGGEHYRLVFGESDGLPGLVIDRYANVFAVQINTAGMEAMRSLVLDALNDLFEPEAIVMCNDHTIRQLEGLTLERELVQGSLPETVSVTEQGLEFAVDLLKGQKTGWYYDQRENRQLMTRFIRQQVEHNPGIEVLDMFSYVGAWGINAAAAGASSVLCVDESASALEQAAQNAARNGLQDKVNTHQADIFQWIKSDTFTKQKYDLVVLDPPALIKRRKDVKNGKNAYRQLNEFALKVVKPGGILITASCSHHFAPEDLRTVLVQGAKPLKKPLQIIAEGRQGLDHPVQAAMPETSYLKAFYVRMPLS